MSERTKALQQIRPELKLDNSLANELETFQNEVLRPILKFQNEILLLTFQEWLSAHKQKVEWDKPVKAMLTIEQALKNNQLLKAQLHGMVQGMMSKGEFEFFQKHKRACNKRLGSMLLKRIQDELRSQM